MLAAAIAAIAAITALALLRILTVLTRVLAVLACVLTASANKRRSCTRRHRPHLVIRRYTIGQEHTLIRRGREGETRR